MNKRKNRIIICLCLFVFMLLIPSLSNFNFTNFNNDTDITLETSTDNYLFNGKEYDIELNDVYDDADPYKIYTGANFSYVFMENESTTFNEVVSNVNNSEKQLGDPIEFTTPYGTTDDLDNMKAYDGSYTSFFSTALPSIHEETPVIWSDFAYTYGSNGGTSGSAPYLDDNDGSYAYMNSASYVVTSGDTLLGYIEPNGNLISNWNEGDTSSHYLSIDEYPDTNGDGLNLRETSETVHDRWNFGSLTLPANSWVSKLEIKFYTLKQTGSGMYIVITSNELSQTSISMTESYSWRTRTLTGLNLDQTELTALYLDVLPAYSGEYNHGYVDIETVYINVYYKTSNTYYRHYSVLTFDYAGGSLDYLDTLYYDYATTVAIDMDLDIWDWVAGSYNVELQSNSGTGYITGSYDLSANPNKVSGTNQVRVRFETSGTTTTDFDVRIDQLMFDYVLTTDADPELEAIMETTFSNYNDPDILGIEINSYHRTDVSQTITFSVYNYITPGWETITSQSQTSFTLNQFQSTSVSDYFDSGTMKIRYYGTSAVQDFDLFIDFINITITYKMDLSHSITFETNGLWKYRWVLIGSLQYTDWTFFEVVDPVPNFHAISESDYTTRWILQGSDISPIEDFHDDINTDYWNLMDVSQISMRISSVPTDDAGILKSSPNDNYGSTDNIVIDDDPTYTRYGFMKWEPPYSILNYTTNSTLDFYSTNAGFWGVYIYETDDFDESTITWNNKPDTGDYMTQKEIPSMGYYKNVDIGKPCYYYEFHSPSGGYGIISSSERSTTSQKPIIYHHLYKNYFGSGYTFMQTNTTELISLKSKDYGVHKTLNSGDYFEVDFQTSSDSLIDLILLKDGVVNKTLTLSQSGNTNFNRHTAQISVSEDLEFDQLKISATLENIDNVKVYDIKTYKYTLTGDYKDFYVGSKRTESVYLTPDEYNLRIFEGVTEMVDTNITIPETGVKQYIYTPIERLECRLTLFSLAEEYLQFEDYHVNVSRSLGGAYGDFWLVDTIFYADVGTNVYIDVYDRFDALIYSDFELAKPYIDLYIEVYSLKIRNEATEIVDYTLQNTDTGSSKSGILFSDEIVEYCVKSGSYSLDYTNYEDMYPREYNFELTTHKTISINSTYHTVYIGLFTYDGLGLDRDWVRLYINDERKDFGFNVIDSETMELIVLDYFNNTLANETIDASAYSEYNLYGEVYSLYLLNRFTYNDLIMNITQVGSGTYMNQLIPASSALLYRFIPDLNYTISATYVNGTIYSIRTINLTLNSQTESFGISTQPTEYPKNVYFGVYTIIGLGIDHDLLRFYIDGNRTDFGFNRIEDMIVALVVKDYFNTTLFDQNVNTSGIYEYNILITLYSLQIKNLQLQETTVDINTTLYEGTLLSEESLYFMLAENYYEIGYYDTNDVYKQFTIYLDSNQAYQLNRSQICFLIYADQQGNHLVFENYKTYLNGSRVYINNFYREIGDIIGIEIKDRYDISIKNDTLTVVSGVNEKYVVLTMYSLKVMSQQLVFNHINITRNSDYYESSMYWSEWIAPGEIIDFRLFAGYYTINITNVEDSSFSLYDYTLNGDDVILLSSDNTLYNVLYNIANVNTTIGNQITNVEINITNQNSAINNTIINIEINLDNINSSLGTMLVDIDTAISNINTSIINEIVSMGTIITNINTSIINQILDIGVNITNMNSSIVSQLLTLGVDISNINGSIIDQILVIGVNISNVQTFLNDQILNIGVNITNLDSSITSQISSVISSIENVNTTILAQISSLSSDIININSSIVSQFVSLGVDITNINTSLSNQILNLEVDITNINSSIIEQILLVIADIENLDAVIDDQTLVILADITNVNSTLLNQMVSLGVDITNINATIYNQILSLNVDLTNINASISNLLFYLDVDITNIANNISTLYIFTNNSFINLNNVMNSSFIYMENNIISINQTISNLVIGVDNSIYLINGTISTMITSLENNLLLMEVSINTALFNLDTTIDIIGANITSNYILLNNTLNIMDTNIDDSRIAMINNLLLVNNTMSTLIANVYSAVYLINNSIYTAVIDLGTYLSLMNNTIDGNLSFILSQNDFLTEIYQMTMFSELLNWTDIGFNTSLLTSQIDAWDFVNHYKNQSIEVHLRYQDLIDSLTVSAQNTLFQYLPATGVEYREWSVDLQEYIGEWKPLPESKKVNFGFFETDVPIVPRPIEADVLMFTAFIVIIAVAIVVIAILYGLSKKELYETPKKVRKMYKNKNRGRKIETFDQSDF